MRATLKSNIGNPYMYISKDSISQNSIKNHDQPSQRPSRSSRPSRSLISQSTVNTLKKIFKSIKPSDEFGDARSPSPPSSPRRGSGGGKRKPIKLTKPKKLTKTQSITKIPRKARKIPERPKRKLHKKQV